MKRAKMPSQALMLANIDVKKNPLTCRPIMHFGAHQCSTVGTGSQVRFACAVRHNVCARGRGGEHVRFSDGLAKTRSVGLAEMQHEGAWRVRAPGGLRTTVNVAQATVAAFEQSPSTH